MPGTTIHRARRENNKCRHAPLQRRGPCTRCEHPCLFPTAASTAPQPQPGTMPGLPADTRPPPRAAAGSDPAGPPRPSDGRLRSSEGPPRWGERGDAGGADRERGRRGGCPSLGGGRARLPRISTRRRRRGEARTARAAPSSAAASAGERRRYCWRGRGGRSAPRPRGCALGKAAPSRGSASRGGCPRRRGRCPAATAPAGCWGWRRRRRGAAEPPEDGGAPPVGCRRPAPAAPVPRPRRVPGRRRR